MRAPAGNTINPLSVGDLGADGSVGLKTLEIGIDSGQNITPLITGIGHLQRGLQQSA